MPKKKNNYRVECEFKKPGDILKENKGLVNYIYDDYGFRIGIVMILPGEGKHHPKLGWALIKEVPHRVNVIHKLSDIPVFKNSNSELLNLDFGDNLTICYNTFADEKAKSELFELAVSRANFDSWNYYVCTDRDKGQNFSDLRNDKISNFFCHTRLTMYPGEIWESDVPTNAEVDVKKCRVIRKAIRNAEYRAWRYFK